MKLRFQYAFDRRNGELRLPVTITIYLNKEEQHLKEELKKLQSTNGCRFYGHSESTVAKTLLFDGLAREQKGTVGYPPHNGE